MKDDLISRSAVIADLKDWLYGSPDDEYQEGFDSALIGAIGRIGNGNINPAVDAVPVVRCRECKWWGLPEGMYATENVKHCEFGRYMVASDGYCVYGEVKSNESE